jgi:hypothetical protein
LGRDIRGRIRDTIREKEINSFAKVAEFPRTPVPVDKVGKETVVFDHGLNVTIGGVWFIKFTNCFDTDGVLVQAARGVLFGLGECVSSDDGFLKIGSLGDRVGVNKWFVSGVEVW